MDIFDAEFPGAARKAYGGYGRYGRFPGSLLRPSDKDEMRRSPRYWIVCASEHGLPEAGEVLCATEASRDPSGERDGGGGGGGGERGRSRALAVFSFREEAEAFSRLQGCGPGLRVREFDGGELVSLLYGPWGGFTRVALDPMPEDEYQAAQRLVIVSRKEFVKLLRSRTRVPSPQPIR